MKWMNEYITFINIVPTAAIKFILCMTALDFVMAKNQGFGSSLPS